MNDEIDERQLAYKLRQLLTQGTDALDAATLERLHVVRQRAPAKANVAVAGRLQLAGVGHFLSDAVLQHGRMFALITTLVAGAALASYWNNFVQADDNEEVDSALLADDLPINAYLDPGFHAWLERNAPQSPQ
jgi:hypothetical protein